MKLFNWYNIRLVLIATALLSLYAFASQKNQNRKLKSIVVDFEGTSQLFLKKDLVNKLLIEKVDTTSSLQKVNVALNTLENSINANKTVEFCNVFMTVDGVLNAKVKQKTPIVRVQRYGGDFYIADDGSEMPLSKNYTERVPIVTGETKLVICQDAIDFYKKIVNDDFYKKNITAIEFRENQGIVLRNRNFDYLIHFGNLTRVDDKLLNYKVFFQKTAQSNLLAQYKLIDLRFNNQVVCTK
jgi:cell division protein FtsQ